MTDFVFNAIGGIFIVLFILVSVAGIVEAYLENKEKDKRREKMAQGKDGEEHDSVSRPAHYTREGAMECIDEMLLVFGSAAVKDFCLLNAWKYRYRAAKKNGDEDMRKSDWYMAKYKELKGSPGIRHKIFRRKGKRRRT